MRTAFFLITAALMLAGCKDEPVRDAEPCDKAVANARRLAADQPGVVAQHGAEPVSLDHCRALTSREVDCVAYASSWDELTACSGALRTRVADKP